MMDQSRYDLLCADLAALHEDLRKRRSNARDFARTFRDEFASYLGCTEHAKDEGDRLQPLVYLANLMTIDGQVVLAPEEADGRDIDFVVSNENLSWVFAIGVRLATHPTSPIKEPYVCRCRFTLDGEIAKLSIADQAFTFNLHLSDTRSFERAFEALFKHFRTFLQSRPYRGGRKQQQMGFLAGGEL